MNYPKISGHVGVHLREATSLQSTRTGSGGFRTTMGGDLYDGLKLTLFGSVAQMRRLAEEIYRMADEVERDGRRQRALDNAPASSRSKFVLEGEKVREFKRAA